MKLYLRLESVSPEHIRETLFFNGANCGTLTLSHGEYQILGAALLLGAQRMRGHLTIQLDRIGHDEHGEFSLPVERSSIISGADVRKWDTRERIDGDMRA